MQRSVRREVVMALLAAMVFGVAVSEGRGWWLGAGG